MSSCCDRSERDNGAREPEGELGSLLLANMMVIVVSGPPCVGKTSVAESLAREFGVPLFAVDPLLQVLTRPELMASPDQFSLGDATAKELQSVLLERQLALGVGAILEHTADRAMRERWRAIAARFDAPYFGIECVCSDRALHRQRFDARPEFCIGEWLLTWEFIERSLDTYEPDEEAAILLDSTNSLEQNVAAAAAALRASRPSTGYRLTPPHQRFTSDDDYLSDHHACGHNRA